MPSLVIEKFSDFLTHGPAEIICPIKQVVIRTMSEKGEFCQVLCGDGTQVDVPLDTPVRFEPWVMDRGSMLFELNGQQLKICTELDLLRTESGDRFAIVPAKSAVQHAR